MIAYLKGKILVLKPSTKKDSFIILEVNGVGYEIMCPPQLLVKRKLGEEVEIYTYHSVREDNQELFGLSSLEDLEFFKLLLTVSGIGPRSALSVMSAATREQIKKAVVQNQPDLLHKISGLGAKTAQKVVDGLKDKLGVEELGRGEGFDDDFAQALDGLLALGYNLFDARKALEKTSAISGASSKIKEALKRLSNRN
ncbi:MAG: Holliday junction branch migration protein RuvA [Candidatus Buchananbacteria bacterium]